MIPQNPRQNIYDPKTLAVMDQAFVAIWQVLRADDPFRDYNHDSELRLAMGKADGPGGEWGDRSCSAPKADRSSPSPDNTGPIQADFVPLPAPHASRMSARDSRALKALGSVA